MHLSSQCAGIHITFKKNAFGRISNIFFLYIHFDDEHIKINEEDMDFSGERMNVD